MGFLSKQPLRRGTWLTVAAVAIVLLAYNLRGRGEVPDIPSGAIWNSDVPRDLDAKYAHGWPLLFLERPCWDIAAVGTGGGAEVVVLASRWTLVSSMPLFAWDPPLWHFSGVNLVLNFLFLLVIAFSTGYATERWLQERSQSQGLETDSRRPIQFTLRSILALTVIVAVMFGILQMDPSLWSSPLDFVVWLLSAFIGFGVLCTLYTVASVSVRIMRRLLGGSVDSQPQRGDSQ